MFATEEGVRKRVYNFQKRLQEGIDVNRGHLNNVVLKQIILKFMLNKFHAVFKNKTIFNFLAPV